MSNQKESLTPHNQQKNGPTSQNNFEWLKFEDLSEAEMNVWPGLIFM